MDLSTLELTNYWLPIIWICAAGPILNMLPKQTLMVSGRVRERWSWFCVIALVLPLVIWAGARVRIGDTAAYRRHFYSAPSFLEDLPAYVAENTKDQGFYFLMGLLKVLGVSEPKGFFLIIASLQMLGMVVTFRKYAPNFWICIFLFVASSDYISWMFNGMRQFLAVTILFAASGLLFRRKLIPYCIIVLVVSLIHGSALMMIPLAFLMQGRVLNKKIWLIMACAVFLMPFADRLMPVLTDILADTQYNDITTNEVWTTDDGTNFIRVLVYSVPALIALLGWRYIVNSSDPAMNFCINSAFVTMALYLISAVTSGIYIGRLPIYTTLYGYMALPWLLEQIFEKETCKLILLLMVALYAVFYYYQMGITWGLL